jgi:hypothetical protein
VINAVVFIPAEHLAQHLGQCLTYCEAKGYKLAGVVRDDWCAVARMVAGGIVGVVVVARADHLDPGREPRLEVVAELEPGHRRTRIIRRGAAA